MKILCLVSYHFLPARAGGQKHIAHYYQHLAEKTDIICVCIKNNDPTQANYPVLNILSNSALRYINVFYFFRLRSIIKSEKISHIQIEHPYYGWLALLLKWFCGVKVIVHSHNIEALRFKSVKKKWWRMLWLYEKWVYNKADFNLFITNEDKDYSIRNYKVNPQKCLTATYGLDWNQAPNNSERETCKTDVCNLLQLKPNTLLLLYNGTFNYQPNLDGLITILKEINPILSAKNIQYAIIICGKHIPIEISSQSYPNVYIQGFVEDISLYFKAADIFLNPIQDGGGIKTKLVEALGYNLSAISYPNGAIGIPENLVTNKLFIVRNAAECAQQVINSAESRSNISPLFFEYFYWGNIINKVLQFIKKNEYYPKLLKYDT